MSRDPRDGGGGGVPHFMGNIFGRRRRAASNDATATATRSSSAHDSTNSNQNNHNTAYSDFVEDVMDAASEAFRSFNNNSNNPSFTNENTDSTPTIIPPASAATIQQLPQITVRPCDVRDPANRECCICLEDIVVGTIVTRLPHCAHLFHTHCVRDWLQRHCTCPTCRYELPTDDAAYEMGRCHRMRHYKPRYARHELQTMRVSELKQLLVGQGQQQRQLPAHIKDKTTLIDFLIQQTDCIDLIPEDTSSTPCAFPIRVLQQMSVRELKHVMNEIAGVFFDPKEVLEKQDMIRIFVASGRLQVLPEEAEEEEEENVKEKDSAAPHPATNGNSSNNISTTDENDQPTTKTETEDRKPAAVQVETVYSDTEEEEAGADSASWNGTSPRVYTSWVMEENMSFCGPQMPSQARLARPNRDDHNDTAEAVSNAPNVPASSPFPAPTATERHASIDPTADADSLADSAHVNGNQNLADSTASASAAPASRIRSDFVGTENKISSTTSASSSSNESLPLTSFQNLSVSQAETAAQERGVDISILLAERNRLDCAIAERLAGVTHSSSSSSSALVENGSQPSSDGESREPHRYRRRRNGKRSRCATAAQDDDDDDDTLLRLFLQDQSVAQLRAMAREKAVDFSRILEKDEMIDRLLDSWTSSKSNALGRG